MNPQMMQTLQVQWKAARWSVLAFALVAFALPQLALRSTAVIAQFEEQQWQSSYMLSVISGWMPLFPILAALTGAALALAAWTWDHRQNHVYALSLPLPRSRYVLLKFAVGAVLLLLPLLALLLGVLIGRLTVEIPDELNMYAFAFGARFLLASLIIYALVFALAAGTIRTTLIVVIGFLAVVILGEIGVSFAEDMLHRNIMGPLELFHMALVEWPGPFHVFGGNWMLIDV